MSTHERLPQWQPVAPFRNFRDAYQRHQIPGPPSPDGKRMHQVPKLPYEWWLKPSGNVVALVVMTTRNLKDAVDPNRYAVYARNNAIRKGWIPWEYAEAQRYAPWVLSQEKVTNEEEWIVKREEILKARRTKHEKESEKYRAAWRTQSEQDALRTKEAMADAFNGFTQALQGMATGTPTESAAAAPMAAPKKRGRKPKIEASDPDPAA